MFVNTELKRNKRDFETLENIIDEANRDLIKTFTDSSDSIIVDEFLNVGDWVNKADGKKQQLDQTTKQNYNEIARKMNHAHIADLLFQMVTNNEITDSLILEKITAQKEHESK